MAEMGKAIVGGEDFQTRFVVTEMLCQGLWEAMEGF